MSTRLRIHLVDDDTAIRRALRRLLMAEGYPVREYARALDFRLALDDGEPAVAILDVAMPGGDGLELHDALVRADRSVAVIFLTAQGDIPMSVRAMKMGAVDFLTKPVDSAKLLAAIHAAERAVADRHARRTERCELEERFATLTSREREVMVHVVAGRLNKQIAALLGTGEQNVKVHRGRVMRKLKVDSLADLVRAAARLGLDPVNRGTP